MSDRTIPVQLTAAEVALLIEALDSHEYWQLSESSERNDGYSTIEDGEKEDIDAVRALISKLEDNTVHQAPGDGS
jgi:hypothetical protein